MDFEEFILAHGQDDTSRLILSVREYPEPPIEGDAREICVSTIESRRALRSKAPEWYAESRLVYPTKLSSEQCSSSATARYKAGIVKRIFTDSPRIADLTGGLGIDCSAFASVAREVLYKEMNPLLCAAARHNFAVLGLAERIRVLEGETGPGDTLPDDFRADLVFLDPARRGQGGRKVFMLEDCSPDVLKIKDELLERCPYILLKLSPMADISMLCRKLGPNVSEVHVLGAGGARGECKELLLLLDRESHQSPLIIVADADEEAPLMSFTAEEEAAARVRMLRDEAELEALARECILFEPSSTVMKAGAFKLLSERCGMVKLARSTQLYLAPEAGPGLARLGKLFRIEALEGFDKAALARFAARWPRCEVSSRNMPLSSDELRKKMGVGSGGDTHIFAFTAEFSEGKPSRKLISARPSGI